MAYPCLPRPRHLGNKIGNDGVHSIAEALKQNATLATLNIAGESEREPSEMLHSGACDV